jgi:hypothetical protein
MSNTAARSNRSKRSIAALRSSRSTPNAGSSFRFKADSNRQQAGGNSQNRIVPAVPVGLLGVLSKGSTALF